MLALLKIMAVVLVAVAMALPLAHALEYPGKMRLSKPQSLATQPIYYPGFSIGGAAEPLALMLTLLLAFELVFRSTAFWLAIGSFLALTAMHAVYWLFTHPANNFWLRDTELGRAGSGFFALSVRGRAHDTADPDGPVCVTNGRRPTSSARCSRPSRWFCSCPRLLSEQEPRIRLPGEELCRDLKGTSFPARRFLGRKNQRGGPNPRKVNVMSSKLLVSMLALGLATGTGAALAQGTGGTEKQGAGVQSQTGGTQMQSQTSTGDESTTSGHKATQTRQNSKQMGQAGQENAPSGTQAHRQGQMKRGEAARSGEKQGQGTMQSQNQGQGSMQGSTETRTTRGTETKGQTTATGETSTGKAQGTSQSASLTSEQRGRITEVIKKENIRPQSGVNFPLSVGTAVPRTVHLHRLPREIVELEPRWRPYEFILVGDEIVIINPRNLEIVAVMPA